MDSFSKLASGRWRMHCFLLEFVYKIHTYIRVHIRMRLSIDFFESFGFGKKGSFPSLRPSGVFPVG